jgi:hypothetical protein
MFRQGAVYIFLAFLTLLAVPTAHGRTGIDAVTITLPETVIRQSVEDILPMPIQPEPGLLEGSLVLERIDRFELGENSAKVQGLLVGKNLVLTTSIGGQDIRVRLGEMQLPLTCDLSFRFAAREKRLYITPQIAEPPGSPAPGKENNLLPLLALLNGREFPVSLEDMESFRTRVGGNSLSVVMEPVDLRVTSRELVLKMMPTVRKTN